MKKQSLFLLLMVFILFGCELKKEAGELPLLGREPIYKRTALSDIYPLSSKGNYMEVLDWLNDEQILYLVEENGMSCINVFHLFSGKTERLFSTTETIVEIDVHENKSLIALSTFDNESRTSIYVLNQNGKALFELRNLSGDVVFYWNYYDDNQLLFVTYLPNWEFELHHLSIKEGKVQKLPIQQPYVQWIDEQTIAYIKWDSDEPSIDAPLMFYHLQTGEENLFMENAIAFFTFPNEMLVVLLVNSLADTKTTYSFFLKKQKTTETYVPVLDTFSEQWWVPYYDYDEQEAFFVFFRPKQSGAFIDYQEPFELVRFDVRSGKEQVLMELDENLPIKLSPNGKYLLYGQRLETFIDIETKEKVSLIEQ